MMGRHKERTAPSSTDEIDTESYVVRNGRRFLHGIGSGRVSDEDWLYGLMQGEKHPPEEFEDSSSDNDIGISTLLYGTQKTLNQG